MGSKLIRGPWLTRAMGSGLASIQNVAELLVFSDRITAKRARLGSPTGALETSVSRTKFVSRKGARCYRALVCIAP